MLRLYHLMYLLIVAMETSQPQHVDDERVPENASLTSFKKNKEYVELKKDVKKLSSYSEWARWSACQDGRKTRRRHCLLRRICGNSLRIEVTSCGNTDSRWKNARRGLHERSSLLNEKHAHIIIMNKTTTMKVRHQEPQVRQLNADVQKKFRGFSPWSTWSPCSRKCATVRRRFCQQWSLCGQKVIRQSAYCYLEGSYCQLWIRSRMQRRKDPGLARLEVMPPPTLAIHPEDSRSYSRAPSPCGRLGRYRGSPRARIKARMSDMIRIIGGRPAPFGKWTWQVAVLNRYKEAFCGGTLISLRWVVTAAHCVRKRLYVRLGEHDLLVRNHGELEMKVTEAVIHPLYDPDTVVNDVAMLRLPTPARPDLGHGIACLPQPYQTLPPHTTCVILGWGKRRPTDVHGTRILHEAQFEGFGCRRPNYQATNLELRSNNVFVWSLKQTKFWFKVSTIQQGVCRRSYWQYAITDNMVCAGRGHRDSCAGDSGGPLLCRDRNMRYYLQGITSFGDGCGKRGKYGIYTRTAGYVLWMRDVMNNKYFDN